jgi:hypothetical protein
MPSSHRRVKKTHPSARRRFVPEAVRRERADRLPSLAGADQQEHDTYLSRLARVQAIRRQHAAAIIAAGVFSDTTEHWTAVMSALAEEATGETRKVLDAFVQKIEAMSPEAVQVPWPEDYDPTATTSVDNVILHHATLYADAGFLVGLAVGMQLGPQAFDAR